MIEIPEEFVRIKSENEGERGRAWDGRDKFTIPPDLVCFLEIHIRRRATIDENHWRLDNFTLRSTETCSTVSNSTGFVLRVT